MWLSQMSISGSAYFGSKEACGDVPNRLDARRGWNITVRIYRPDGKEQGD
jgi:hypothetical protein